MTDSAPEARIESFAAFWPYYVGEHRSPTNRLLHYWGTSMGLALLITGAVTLNPLFIPAALVFGYGNAWIGHFVIEKNRPATFSYPLWSFFGDLKMLALGLTGRMGAEVERLYGSRHPAPDAPLRSAT